jgi:hypothetical protein
MFPMLPTGNQVEFWLFTLVCAGIGAYASSYLKKKGENLATHEDIDKVLDQVRAVTTTTKEIEAKISGEVWDRQKRWELKRDVMMQVATKSAKAKDALVQLHAIVLTNKRSGNPHPALVEKQNELNAAWLIASNELEQMVFIASLACCAEVVTALANFALFTSELVAQITNGHPEALFDQREQLADTYNAITKAMRKEIGNDSQPMFLTNESSAARTPDH